MKRFFTLLLTLPGIYYVAGQTTLFTEGFDYPPGPLPSAWVIDAEQPPGWSINNSLISGGEAPELYMTYGFQVGLSRLISPVIEIEGYSELSIRYKQYLINYLADWGETIGVDVTFDGGDNWQPLWERPLGLLNIPQDEFVYFVNAPDGASEMQIAFRFDGNNNAINGWAIDDIIVEDAVNNDLLISNIEGNTTPNAGEESVYTVEITNGGKLTQADYTVKLMSDEVELASVSGQSIAFAEKKAHTLSWTPGQSDLGEHSIYAVVEFTGDENQENNQSKNMVVNIQPENTENVQVGDDNFVLQHAIPYNFFNLHTLAQTLYPSEQIGTVEESSMITGIQYTCQFDEDVQGVPIQIYMTETDQEDLSSDWYDPSSFTPVFDGTVDFQKGFNSLYIPLDTPFEYTGKNLVVYSNKSYTQQVLWSTFIATYNDDIIYSRESDSDGEPFDAMNPPFGYMVLYSPNITLFFSSGEMSVIDGLNSAELTLYPNPVSEILNIQMKNDETIIEVKLIDSTGKTVSQKTIANKQAEFNVKGLSPGFYLAQVRTSKGIITKKFIKK